MSPLVLRGAVAALVVLLAVAVWLPLLRPAPADPEVATLLDEPRPLPDAQLVDQHGRPFSLDTLEGRFSLVFFGFTHCPDICPITLHVLSEAMTAFDGRNGAAPQLVFVSVDPARDTPERMREYLGNFSAGFVGVTADDEAMAPLLGALGVHVHRLEHEGEHYNVVHNSTVYVVGPRTDLVAVFGSAEEPAVIAEDFERIRARYLRNHPL